jgi:hypothetical protein
MAGELPVSSTCELPVSSTCELPVSSTCEHLCTWLNECVPPRASRTVNTLPSVCLSVYSSVASHSVRTEKPSVSLAVTWRPVFRLSSNRIAVSSLTGGLESRPTLKSTHSRFQWVPGLSWCKTAGAWRWPSTPSRAEVKERIELHLNSPSSLSLPVLGWNLPSPFREGRGFVWISVALRGRRHGDGPVCRCARLTAVHTARFI